MFKYIFIIIIGILVVIAIGLLIKSGGEKPQPQPGLEPRPHPQTEEDPWGNCKQMTYDPKNVDYNFVGTLNLTLEKPADQFLEIQKDEEKRIFSLGKFRLPLETNTFLRIERLWLYFFSEKLSDREDWLYGLEDSYLSKIILKVGDKTKEINLGKSGEHAFIELTDCPLGNIYAVDYETFIEFEFLLEIGCNNFKENKCLDNKNKPLDYIDNAELQARIRLFVISFDKFTKDIFIPVKFKYE